MKKIFKVALVAGAVLCVGKLILALKESADYVPERWPPDFSGEGYDSCGKRRGVSHIEIVVKDASDGSTDAPDEKGACEDCEDADPAAPSTCGEAPDGKPDEHGTAEQETRRSKSKRSVKSKDAEEDNNGQ